MKQLTCEICDSINVVKQDGLFVCQSCSMKYSVEEAKKMMFEDISQDSQANMVEKHLHLVQVAMRDKNWDEVLTYSEKILEIDSRNAEAWVFKGYVLAQKSMEGLFEDESSPNFNQAKQCFDTAFDNGYVCSDKNDLIIDIATHSFLWVDKWGGVGFELLKKCYKNEPNDDKLTLQILEQYWNLSGEIQKIVFAEFNLSDEVRFKLGESIIENMSNDGASQEEIQQYSRAIQAISPASKINVYEKMLKEIIEDLKDDKSDFIGGDVLFSLNCELAQTNMKKIRSINPAYVFDDEILKLDKKYDELLPKAIEMAVELRQISVAMLQRRFKIGYQRADEIIDQMEERGITDLCDEGIKPRKILISKEKFVEICAVNGWEISGDIDSYKKPSLECLPMPDFTD